MTRTLNFGSFSNVGIGSSSSLRNLNSNLMRFGENWLTSDASVAPTCTLNLRNEQSTENKASNEMVTRCNSNLTPRKHYGNLSEHHVVDHLDLCRELHLLSSTPSHLPTLLFIEQMRFMDETMSFRMQSYNLIPSREVKEK
ncbi:hypothetical protein G4B88_000329 [Cannabis sativa]|uniref:Uncharacterized protein n=1 Tax=Cannabis sativa TaxID=3483 RepID=A0A7J6DVF5_CANSA|nr:hypothetical protein G4B88_000329 [Cannabis sativa]